MLPIISGGKCTHICDESSFGVTFLDAASVDPEELQAIMSSLLSAEADLGIACFALACTVYYIFKGNLFVNRTPSMRKNSIWRNALANNFDQTEFAGIFKPQKTHKGRIVSER